MGFLGAVCGAIGGIRSKIGGAIERTNDTNVKKEETEFEKTQKYIKEVEKKLEEDKYLNPESKLKDIKLDDGEKNLNWQDLRSKQNIKEDLAEEKEEDKWKKLDKLFKISSSILSPNKIISGKFSSNSLSKYLPFVLVITFF